MTKWVEDSIAGVRGVKHITSTISEGSSVTTVEFRLEVNADRAVNDVKDAISRSASIFRARIDEPVISRVEIAGLPILVYAVKAPAMTPAELSWLVEDNIARTLQGVKGVGGVERVGGVAREMRVTLQPDRLLALGITAADVNRQLRVTSADMSGGRGAVGGREQSIRALAAARTVGRSEGDLDRRTRRPQGPSRRPRHSLPTPSRSRAPLRVSTANRSWLSRCRAAPVPATPTSRPASKSGSPNFASSIRISRSRKSTPRCRLPSAATIPPWKPCWKARPSPSLSSLCSCATGGRP